MKARITKVFAVVGVVCTLLFIFALTGPGDRYFEMTKNMDIFATLFKEVNTYYVDEVNPQQLMETGIESMLESLDPYTNYISEDEIEDYRTMTTGQYGGVGAIIGTRDNKVLVLMPYENYPAYKSGLRIGDELIEIDGVNVQGKSTADVSKMLKGQAGTDVKVTVKRFGMKNKMEISMKRERVKIDNVPYYGMAEGDIGYLRLAEFTNDAAKEVKNALLSLKKSGAKKVIIDLRGNPGGLLNEAVDISNIFIDKDKEIVSTKGKVAQWNKVYKALNPSVDIDIPVAVLVSRSSASASEIVSGVIQDYDRGVLVGQRTYGKGLVQTTRPLSYNSQLKITTAKYYIPSGRCIQAIDYSHRNPDGSVGTIPDSLRKAFKTMNGRVVYDGGGVTPDVETTIREYAPITVALTSKFLLFDYATKYYSEHKQIKSAREFKLSDQDYQEFVNWLSNKDYDYTTKVENDLKTLEENAKKEKYFDLIKTRIDALRSEVKHNKESDLKRFKSEIKELLEQEIISRYYLQRGIIESAFDSDEEIRAAVKVLNDPASYNKLLQKKN